MKIPESNAVPIYFPVVKGSGCKLFCIKSGGKERHSFTVISVVFEVLLCVIKTSFIYLYLY